MDRFVLLAVLSDRLIVERDFIIERWRAEVGASVEEKLVEALSRQEFYDDIPGFLAHFCARLRGDASATPTAPARRHGAHRWQQGLTFAETFHEWQLLHRILIDRVGKLWMSIGLDAERLPQVYRLLADVVGEAIETSLAEYHTRTRADAETRVSDLEAVLVQHQDLDSARGRDLHQVSHDLLGSLQTVRNSCYLLKKESLGSNAQDIVKRLSGAGEGLEYLLKNLRNLARLEARLETCRLDDFDAAELFRELATAMQSTADVEGLALTVRGTDRLMVRSDEAKLRRIAQNLVSNALNYTVEGVVEIGWYVCSSKSWSFYVHDSGPGLTAITQDNPLAANLEQAGRGEAETANGSPGEEPRSEQSSSLLNRPMHGEGIGLTIVHQLCELLDAVLEIDSESGHGTTFRVQFPLNDRKSSEPGDAPTQDR